MTKQELLEKYKAFKEGIKIYAKTTLTKDDGLKLLAEIKVGMFDLIIEEIIEDLEKLD